MQWQQCVRANRTIGNLAGQGFLVSEQGNALCSGKITMQEFSESTVQYSSNEVLQYIGRRWQARVVHNGGFNGDCLDPVFKSRSELANLQRQSSRASHRTLLSLVGVANGPAIGPPTTATQVHLLNYYPALLHYYPSLVW